MFYTLQRTSYHNTVNTIMAIENIQNSLDSSDISSGKYNIQLSLNLAGHFRLELRRHFVVA